MDVLLLSPESKNLLIDIKFIGYCPPEKKISLVQRQYIEPNAWTVQNLWRQLRWETRADLISYTDRVIQDATEFLQRERNKDIIYLFFTSLKEMLTGLENLKETYKSEPDVFSALSVYIEQLKILIRNISTKYNFKLEATLEDCSLEIQDAVNKILDGEEFKARMEKSLRETSEGSEPSSVEKEEKEEKEEKSEKSEKSEKKKKNRN